jgi:hypothetical protein
MIETRKKDATMLTVLGNEADYEGWMTEGPARTSASATDWDLVIIMYTSPCKFWGTTQLPSVMGMNWFPPLQNR